MAMRGTVEGSFEDLSGQPQPSGMAVRVESAAGEVAELNATYWPFSNVSGEIRGRLRYTAGDGTSWSCSAATLIWGAASPLES